MTRPLIDEISQWAAELLRDADLVLYDVELDGGILRVTVQRDGGVGLDDIARFSRALSAILDTHDPIRAGYTLEVSSPGLERKLRTPAHWQGAVGESVRVKLHKGVADDRRISGTVAAADDGAVTITLADGGTHRVAFTDIDTARTVFVWETTPKPGKSPASKKSSSPTKKKAVS